MAVSNHYLPDEEAWNFCQGRVDPLTGHGELWKGEMEEVVTGQKILIA